MIPCCCVIDATSNGAANPQKTVRQDLRTIGLLASANSCLNQARRVLIRTEQKSQYMGICIAPSNQNLLFGNNLADGMKQSSTTASLGTSLGCSSSRVVGRGRGQNRYSPYGYGPYQQETYGVYREGYGRGRGESSRFKRLDQFDSDLYGSKPVSNCDDLCFSSRTEQRRPEEQKRSSE